MGLLRSAGLAVSSKRAEGEKKQTTKITEFERDGEKIIRKKKQMREKGESKNSNSNPETSSSTPSQFVLLFTFYTDVDPIRSGMLVLSFFVFVLVLLSCCMLRTLTYSALDDFRIFASRVPTRRQPPKG